MNNIIEIRIPENLRNDIQRADMEYQSRRNILIYIMQNDIAISQERINNYQVECDNKFIIFEQLKNKLEKEYVIPAVGNKKYSWKLDYLSSIISISII